MYLKCLSALFLLISSVTYAESVGNWKVTIKDDYKNVSTTYVDGSEFGITCKEFCFYYLMPKNDCKRDSEDLTLISNNGGDTLLVNNKCVKHENANFYMFDSFNDITELVKNDEVIQFINDLNSHKKNRVITYSLSGFKSVIEKYFTSQ